jgi:hypothetical protein
LRPNADEVQTIYFVDHSSMISDQKSLNVSLIYGSGKLLTDMLLFADGRKIVFIGDPAQLPPVNYLHSPALNTDYLVNNFSKPSEMLTAGHSRFSIRNRLGRNVKELQRHIANFIPYLHKGFRQQRYAHLLFGGSTGQNLCREHSQFGDRQLHYADFQQ